MSTYAISSRSDEPAGYDVHIVGKNGVRQTLLGFASEADAEAWIEADQARDKLDAGE
jgi:hypothetical protein